MIATQIQVTNKLNDLIAFCDYKGAQATPPASGYSSVVAPLFSLVQQLYFPESNTTNYRLNLLINAIDQDYTARKSRYELFTYAFDEDNKPIGYSDLLELLEYSVIDSIMTMDSNAFYQGFTYETSSTTGSPNRTAKTNIYVSEWQTQINQALASLSDIDGKLVGIIDYCEEGLITYGNNLKYKEVGKILFVPDTEARKAYLIDTVKVKDFAELLGLNCDCLD